MFELEELKKKIIEQNYLAALQIIDELEEMSREDKINKIYSYLVILLIHLIKQEAEKRTTSLWKRSILNSVDDINKTNKKRRKAGGYYLDKKEITDLIEEAYPRALREAACEAFEGKMNPKQLEQKIQAKYIKDTALSFFFNR